MRLDHAVPDHVHSDSACGRRGAWTRVRARFHHRDESSGSTCWRLLTAGFFGFNCRRTARWRRLGNRLIRLRQHRLQHEDDRGLRAFQAGSRIPSVARPPATTSRAGCVDFSSASPASRLTINWAFKSASCKPSRNRTTMRTIASSARRPLEPAPVNGWIRWRWNVDRPARRPARHSLAVAAGLTGASSGFAFDGGTLLFQSFQFAQQLGRAAQVLTVAETIVALAKKIDAAQHQIHRRLVELLPCRSENVRIDSPGDASKR